AAAEKDRIDMLTVHNYTGAKTIDQLLSPQVHASELTDISSQLAAARSAHLPIRVDETNSAVGGGVAGVSDVYASSLWAMDYSLVLAQAGFSGVNLHGGFGVCGAPLYNGKFQLYTPICAATEQNLSTKIFTAMPEYYGLYMATRMGSGRFLPVTVSADQNITAYAVRGDDGRLRIAVIDKDATSAAPVPISVNVGGTARDASVLRLTGRSLDSADGVTVQGRAVDRAGRLDPGPAGQVPVHHGTVRLTMASGSALVLTLDGRA
ncbi:MAG TPA: glycosyl hydrolase family 79 C-terminal domain-containing protein, partial [Actinoplanes sp.]|nr:glycosyl hydrolase family 79 C-terminal domain-containing protein [Actinoplanes sp.]